MKRFAPFFPNESLYSIFSTIYKDSEGHQPFLKTQEGGISADLVQSNQMTVRSIKKQLDPYFDDLPQDYDKVLVVDLCRLIAADDRFSDDLLEKVGMTTLGNYRAHCGSLVTLLARMKESAKGLFHEIDFRSWKQREEKSFLKAKRDLEKSSKTYPKPYLDYLEKEENAQFQEWWKDHRWDCILAILKGEAANGQGFASNAGFAPYLAHFQQWHSTICQGGEKDADWMKAYGMLQGAVHSLTPQLAVDYIKTMRTFEELDRPVLGRYRLRPEKIHLEKNLVAAFYPAYGFGYGRSQAYRQAATQGSLFKLVTSYEALVQRFQKLGEKPASLQEMNPLVMIDDTHMQGNLRCIGYTEDGKSIPQIYKGGRLPRSLAHLHIGRVNLLKALEVSSNPYFSLLAGECLDHPDDLAKAARLFSYGSRTGIELPGEIPGNVPDDLLSNRTGLYAMAIGQHSLVVTPLQTALMLSALANGGKVFKPKLVKLTAGREGIEGDDQIICLPEFPYQESLSFVGIDFPLFSSVVQTGAKSLVKATPTEVRREIFMPDVIRRILLKGLRAVTQRTHQENLTSLTRLYQQYPEAIRLFTEMKDQLLGKTSTSESVENIDLDLKEGTNIYTHVWFGSIAFEKNQSEKNKAVFHLLDEFGSPELVVVVYLRYGGYGKEAAPLAAQIVKKWREIKQMHERGVGG